MLGNNRQTASRGGKTVWNHHPQLPIETAPYFNWPPQPVRIIRWVAGLWLPITERGMIVALSILTWLYLTPALERCQMFALDWIAEIYVRNFVLMFVIACGLPCCLFCFRSGCRFRFSGFIGYCTGHRSTG